jgi:hypothetical protein
MTSFNHDYFSSEKGKMLPAPYHFSSGFNKYWDEAHLSEHKFDNIEIAEMATSLNILHRRFIECHVLQTAIPTASLICLNS